MPRYFFHLDDGEPDLDVEGTILADVELARDAALRFLSQSLLDRSDAFWASGKMQLTVTDEAGVVLFDVAVASTGAPPREVTLLPPAPT